MSLNVSYLCNFMLISAVFPALVPPVQILHWVLVLLTNYYICTCTLTSAAKPFFLTVSTTSSAH